MVIGFPATKWMVELIKIAGLEALLAMAVKTLVFELPPPMDNIVTTQGVFERRDVVKVVIH